uniref:Endonuclease/exonuclease/phosphatase domain-containing protein n=1 Tax=Salarias fasciatus TaxID=181472 RepID=A0A672G702_SALFA
MSYNILAQDLLDLHPYLYTYCPLELRDWGYRCSLLLQEIQKCQPDILCLQEVQENHYEQQLQPALSLMGYTCVFKRRTGPKPDGCATCYRGSRFVCAATTQLEYFRPETGLLDRHNVGVVLLLRPLVDQGARLTERGPPLCVANTHLLFSPRRGDVKLAQLAILLAEIDRVVKSCRSSGEHCNVVLCGDLNAVPDTPLCRLITAGSLFYRGLSRRLRPQRPEAHRVPPPAV